VETFDVPIETGNIWKYNPNKGVMFMIRKINKILNKMSPEQLKRVYELVKYIYIFE